MRTWSGSSLIWLLMVVGIVRGQITITITIMVSIIIARERNRI